nr:unnamed protein product [Digitaria exilis]
MALYGTIHLGRLHLVLYTVCYGTSRYPTPFPECDVNMFWEWGESKVVRPHNDQQAAEEDGGWGDGWKPNYSGIN